MCFCRSWSFSFSLFFVRSFVSFVLVSCSHLTWLFLAHAASWRRCSITFSFLFSFILFILFIANFMCLALIWSFKLEKVYEWVSKCEQRTENWKKDETRKQIIICLKANARWQRTRRILSTPEKQRVTAILLIIIIIVTITTTQQQYQYHHYHHHQQQQQQQYHKRNCHVQWSIKQICDYVF